MKRPGVGTICAGSSIPTPLSMYRNRAQACVPSKKKTIKKLEGFADFDWPAAKTITKSASATLPTMRPVRLLVSPASGNTLNAVSLLFFAAPFGMLFCWSVNGSAVLGEEG